MILRRTEEDDDIHNTRINQFVLQLLMLWIKLIIGYGFVRNRRFFVTKQFSIINALVSSSVCYVYVTSLTTLRFTFSLLDRVTWRQWSTGGAGGSVTALWASKAISSRESVRRVKAACCCCCCCCCCWPGNQYESKINACNHTQIWVKLRMSKQVSAKLGRYRDQAAVWTMKILGFDLPHP